MLTCIVSVTVASLKCHERSYCATILEYLHSVSLYRECSYPRHLHVPFLFSFSSLLKCHPTKEIFLQCLILNNLQSISTYLSFFLSIPFITPSYDLSMYRLVYCLSRYTTYSMSEGITTFIHHCIIRT